MPCSGKIDRAHGHGGEAISGGRSSAMAAAGYRALGGQRGATGGGEAHRAALT
jgi:hypothetical protein